MKWYSICEILSTHSKPFEVYQFSYWIECNKQVALSLLLSQKVPRKTKNRELHNMVVSVWRQTMPNEGILRHLLHISLNKTITFSLLHDCLCLYSTSLYFCICGKSFSSLIDVFPSLSQSFCVYVCICHKLMNKNNTSSMLNPTIMHESHSRLSTR